MDLEPSPSILDTPSIFGSNIATNPMMFKSSYITDTISDDNNTSSSSNPSSIATTTRNDESSSAEIKLSTIEHHLKQSFTQPREPTESPFRKIAEAGVLSISKNISIPLTSDDGIPIEIPSTAEVMNVIESFSKNLAKDNLEREATTQAASENNRLDSSPTHPMGVIVSPKKKLLIRSQSHTEPTSPPSNHFLDEPAMEFQRLQDLPMLDANPQVDVHPKPSISNKRTFQPPLIAIPKANSILIPQHEVTSTGQLLNIKRQKTTVISTNDDYLGGGSDDHRKKQIRDSNREAARRCRERRRHHIEQLEGNLEQCKLQIKQLNEKLSRAEHENTQFRAIISEAKIFHSSSRHSSNESLVEFANAISAANGIELSSEAMEGTALQRNFITRHTH